MPSFLAMPCFCVPVYPPTCTVPDAHPQDVVHATPHLDDPNSGDIFFFDVSETSGWVEGVCAEGCVALVLRYRASESFRAGTDEVGSAAGLVLSDSTSMRKCSTPTIVLGHSHCRFSITWGTAVLS
jgi:hypothetical protein